MDKKQIVNGVSSKVVWWVGERHKKFDEVRLETMAINPFLLPLIFGIHTFKNFDELTEFLVAGHLLTGYATGFGKLIDEKILPEVFGTKKLSKANRKDFPLSLSMFDEIDHLVINGEPPSLKLLSLKAGRWTIQLTGAVKLNNTFEELIKYRESKTLGKYHFNEIAVGVLYGTKETLTDKYDILRGINRGANHTVVDITEHVNVYAGKELWAWINNGEQQTQEWVLQGILDGYSMAESKYGSFGSKVLSFQMEFSKIFKKHIRSDKSIDWIAILREING